MAARRKRKKKEEEGGFLRDLFERGFDDSEFNFDDAQRFVKMFEPVIGVAMGPKRRLMDQLGQFATHFSQSAFARWPEPGTEGQQCVMSGCGGEAVARCMACGAVVCMAHMHLSHRAEGLCDQCVLDLMQMKGAQPGNQAPPPGTGRNPTNQDIANALAVLNLPRGAEWTEIQRAHRKLAAQYHPDRATSEADRQMLENQSKRINEAFALLRKVHERKAA